jgi:hypothetical protein
VIDVQSTVELVTPTTTCPARRYQLFHGERDLQGAIIELQVAPTGSTWAFSATVVQPNLHPDPEGGFSVIESYCHVIGGVVERGGHGWHAFERAP